MEIMSVSEKDDAITAALAERLLSSPLEVLLGEARDLSRAGHGDSCHTLVKSLSR